MRFEIDRAGLGSLIENDVLKAGQLAQRMIAQVGDSGYVVDTVTLIGGVTRMPIIQETLKSALPMKPMATMHADVAVEMGAVNRHQKVDVALSRNIPDGMVLLPAGTNDGTDPDFGYYSLTVDSFAANGCGLYDMAGNLWEWVFDWHPFCVGSHRVIRGGSWRSLARYCRVAYRNCDCPGYAHNRLGFRAVITMGQQ